MEKFDSRGNHACEVFNVFIYATWDVLGSIFADGWRLVQGLDARFDF